MFRSLFKRTPKREIPPCPPVGDPGYLEWVARHHPALVVRACASKTLAQAAERRAQEARLRAIIREELSALSMKGAQE